MAFILLLFVSAVLTFLAYLAIRRKIFVDKVNAIPGPRTDPIVGNLFHIARYNFEVLPYAEMLHNTFDGIFRVWISSFPYIILDKPEYVEAVLSSVHHIDKSNDYSTLHPWLRFGLLTSTGAKWHARRRLITPTFHFKILDEFIPVFNRNTSVLVRNLAREADRGTAFDVGRHVHLCALDTICESAMGTMVQAQDNSESEYVHAVKVACCKAYERLVKPWIYPDLTFYFTPAGCSFRKAVRVLHGLTQSVIKARVQEVESSIKLTAEDKTSDDGVKRRFAFLDQLIMANQKGAGLSEADIQEEVDTFMFEGHDTTGTAISFALYELARNTDIQELVYEEVVSVLGSGKRDITAQDLNEMKYLERFVKETVRLYPSVPVFLRHIKTDVKLNAGPKGQYIAPAGSTIFISPYLLHRVESLWPDPERFDPDRFLPENSAGRHPYSYIPFSAGPRNCIGQKYAMLEMKLMLARLVMEFRFFEAYPGYQTEVVCELILKPKGDSGIMVRIKKRCED